MRFIDIADTDDDDTPSLFPGAQRSGPRYPYGTQLCFNQALLDKLGLDSDCEVGELLDMRIMAKVTSVSKSEVNGEKDCRIELQIAFIGAPVENEGDEDPTEED